MSYFWRLSVKSNADANLAAPPPMDDEGDPAEPVAGDLRAPLVAPPADPLAAVESERVVLSRVLRATETLAIPQQLMELVGEEDFSLPAHRAIVRVAVSLLEGGRCPSPTAVLASAKAEGHEVGGVEYLAQLVADPVWAGADDTVVLADAAIVRDQSTRRRIRANLLGQVASLGGPQRRGDSRNCGR